MHDFIIVAIVTKYPFAPYIDQSALRLLKFTFLVNKIWRDTDR